MRSISNCTPVSALTHEALFPCRAGALLARQVGSGTCTLLSTRYLARECLAPSLAALNAQLLAGFMD